MTTYKNPIGTVPVGTKFEAVERNGRTVRKGDIVAFDDPDIDHRDWDRGIHSRLFVGKVEAILLPNSNPTGEPQIFATTPIGKLAIDDVEVSGEGAIPDPQSGTAKFIEQFLSGDYSKYLTLEWGEDIDGSGEDHKRTGE